MPFARQKQARTLVNEGIPVPTINQLVRKGRQAVKYKTASPALQSSPQKRGVCTRASTRKRPRSQTRRCARWRVFV